MRSVGRTGSRGTPAASLCSLVVGLSLPAVAVGSTSVAPRRLVDGSIAPAVPTALHAYGPALVMTRVRTVPVKEIRRLVHTCARGETVPMTSRVVERVGVNGRDITFLVTPTSIAGCDRSPRARELNSPWCGGSAWSFRGGVVSDPRLDVCYDRSRKPFVAFAWINPVRHARWVVIDQPGFREVYPVAAHLPVRVSTVSKLVRGGASFRTAQYDARGVLLVRRVVTAAIAS